jgi:very-short-patch-repair endonuclease
MLWSRPGNRQLEGFKFRRQVPTQGYVADSAMTPSASLNWMVDNMQNTLKVIKDEHVNRNLQAISSCASGMALSSQVWRVL